MTTKKEQVGKRKCSSLMEFYAAQREDILRKCDLCGKCVEVCRVLPFTPLAQRAAVEVARSLLRALEGQFSDESRLKAFSCLSCGGCLKSCPQGLDPETLQLLVRLEYAKGETKRPLYATEEWRGQRYDIYQVLKALQVKPSEERWIPSVPENPRQADTVLFLGCNVVSMPDKVLTVLDVLERMDVSPVALSGGELCCGARPLLTEDVEEADRQAKALIAGLSTFKPKRVLLWCGTCYYKMKLEFPLFMEVPFPLQQVSQFIADNLNKLHFTNRVEKTVTLQDFCSLGGHAGDYDSGRKILEAIPGLKLVEMPRHREDFLCCGGRIARYFPEIADQLTQERLDEAEGTGAQRLVTMCQGCHSRFSRYEDQHPYQVVNYVTALGEALGISREDKLKRFLLYRDAGRVLEESEEYIDASPYTREEMRELVPRYFQ